MRDVFLDAFAWKPFLFVEDPTQAHVRVENASSIDWASCCRVRTPDVQNA